MIGLVAYVDSRRYMNLYNSLLKRHGFKIKGTPRFIAKSVQFDDFDRITLGDRLVASMNVHFLTHDYSFTTALIASGETPTTDIGILRDIVVGDNVFIGMNSILLPGTIIGNHVIVGAGSVVRGTIPDYSLVAGNPAQVIGDIREYATKIKNRNAQSIHVDKR
jgi:acetyltransferase-like isoleucine patch superfamily enzyme